MLAWVCRLYTDQHEKLEICVDFIYVRGTGGKGGDKSPSPPGAVHRSIAVTATATATVRIAVVVVVVVIIIVGGGLTPTLPTSSASEMTEGALSPCNYIAEIFSNPVVVGDCGQQFR